MTTAECAADRLRPLQVRKLLLEWGKRTYVMGILNITPDSFSGDGLLLGGDIERHLDEIVEAAVAMVDDGADILDIGGESTRPGATPISARDELTRVVPAIRAIRAAVDIPLSIDTYRATVASAAIEAGVDMVNDIWGLRYDPHMAEVVAESNLPVVVMHNRSLPKDARQEERLGGHYVGIAYEDLLTDIVAELHAQVRIGLAAGIARDKIIIDPGVGFGKTVDQNMQLLRHASELRELRFPILIGASNKSFVGYTLAVPPNQRLEGSLAGIGVAIMQRAADIVRVHAVKPTVRYVRMLDAILRA
ncbi:MAG: dihydropteroate synthase [Chloroflexi bacterium]|jgi:dihydropteroate synthase|nr:dihydropteroate synthase [Chloroflexota bacterium]